MAVYCRLMLPEISQKSSNSQKIYMRSVENQRIFPRYSLVYLLPFLYVILLPFTLYFVSFLFYYFAYIYLYHVTHLFNKEKFSFLLSFHMVSEPRKVRARVLSCLQFRQPI